jgi:methionyl-tRNA formyltransferase
MDPGPRIIFFGTPEFAVWSLKAIRESGYPVAGVVTAPDKPAGRGMKLRSSPVKIYALEYNLPVLQPENLSDPSFLKALSELKPDLQVVVAFRMMPKAVWAMPQMGTFNLHASLLPQYRGAAPINWAIINGEKETGLTTFFLKEKADTGDIIFREKVIIGKDETAGELHNRMKIDGAALVVRTIESIIRGRVNACSQEDLAGTGSKLLTAPRIFTGNCRIDWDQPSEKIYNLIRGLSPVPAAFTMLKMNDNTIHHLKILRAGYEKPGSSRPPGSLVTDNQSYLKISARNGDICIYELQLPGRKTMKTEDFLRGFGSRIT